MSKIICDVCGTSYPESATQCPICGCVRPADVNTVVTSSDEMTARPNGTYTYVKGGRFSKANVKKRNQGKVFENAEPAVKPEETKESGSSTGNKGFFIAIAVLLVAIVAVSIYITVQFIVPSLKPDVDNQGDSTPSTSETTTNTTSSNVGACEEILLNKTVINFEHAGAAIFLNATLKPADTTDVLQFASGDESVATVDQEGRITAVGNGETTITVSCGDVKATCQVVCAFDGGLIEPTESSPDETTETSETTTNNTELKLNREDFTLSAKGKTWKLYDGEIPADQITWTSDDEKVATIKDGVVTAVGGGYTTVHAEYQGQKASCIVRCGFTVTEEENNITAQGPLKLSAADVTLKIGEKFTLNLLDGNNNSVDVVWQVSDAGICSAEGNTITALSSGKANVSVTIDGVTYTCIVRVS